MRESNASLSTSHPTNTLQDLVTNEQIETRPASLPDGDALLEVSRGSELDLLHRDEGVTSSLEAKNSPTEDGIFNLTIAEPREPLARLSRSSTSSDGSQKSSRKRTGHESPRRRKRVLSLIVAQYLMV